MAETKLKAESITHQFKDTPVFDKKDIMALYRQMETDVNPTTLNWRIHALVQLGVIQRIGRGKFTLEKDASFKIEVSTEMQSIYTKLKREFPFAEFCIWNTIVLNEFMVHQPSHFYLLIETEKETLDAVFYLIREMKKPAFLNPTEDILEKYAYHEREVIIVRPIVTEAPTEIVEGVNTATLEKILVDIFCDNVLFQAQQGTELQMIFNEAFNKYPININKMLRYANRRAKKNDLIEFLETIPNYRHIY
ncbi:MAG: hypothetical protein EOM23_05730 [Candidatus Moranbacteria bacterium]|nr:hypothetical protein [Candidatus Moranbacteria bacterium]